VGEAGPRLLLASASPRRRELLTLAGVRFEAVATDVDELTEGDPAEVVVENALRKARAGQRAGTGLPVLGADTDVAIDGRLLGKAYEEGQARERLRSLSGRTHEVLGAVALLDGRGERTALERTRVTFVEIGETLLDVYVRSGEWQDRAGAYAVQGLGAALVERVEGDLANVIGLPLRALGELAPEIFEPSGLRAPE
jgi:septum formation protein